MERFKNHDGYVLISVLLVFLVVSLISVTLLSLTVQSYSVVQASEDSMNAQLVAEAGMEEVAVAFEDEIKQLNLELKNGSSGIQEIISRLDSRLNQLANNGKLEKTVSNGKYTYTLVHENLKDGSDGVFTKKVIVTVRGKSGGLEESLTRTWTVTSIADVFKYSAVTPGDLKLNGAPYIEGDVFVGGNLYSRKYGKFITSGITYWKETSYPAINGDLTLKKSLYKYSGTSCFLIFCEERWDKITPLTSEKIASVFSLVPRLSTANPEVTRINVGQLINSKKNAVPSTVDTIKNEDDYYINGTKIISSSTLYPKRWKLFYYIPLHITNRGDMRVNGNLVVDGDLEIKNGGKLWVDGDVYITGDASLSGEIILTNGHSMYIGGDAYISNLNLTGSIYINKEATIVGDLNANGTIYARNKIEVTDLSNRSGGTLVLLSEGTIDIFNNNLYNDAPKVIDAYFYSNSELEIYGIGSNLQINGGIYGNPIILNAVKGKTKDRSFSGSTDRYGGLYFESNQDRIDPKKSRLSVYYKEDLILNPPAGIPTVQELTIQEIDQRFE